VTERTNVIAKARRALAASGQASTAQVEAEAAEAAAVAARQAVEAAERASRAAEQEAAAERRRATATARAAISEARALADAALVKAQRLAGECIPAVAARMLARDYLLGRLASVPIAPAEDDRFRHPPEWRITQADAAAEVIADAMAQVRARVGWVAVELGDEDPLWAAADSIECKLWDAWVRNVRRLAGETI